MSTTIETNLGDLSTEDVENRRYRRPVLNSSGQETVSNITLVTKANLRPVTLGERIRRYMRSPQFQQDLNDENGYDPDDLEEIPLEDENPLSKYEDRTFELQNRVKTRKAKEADDKKEADKLKHKEELLSLRNRLEELQREGAIPLPDKTPKDA